MRRSWDLVIAASVTAVILLLGAATAQADTIITGSCVGTWWNGNCVKTIRHVPSSKQELVTTEQERAAAAERERKWEARCQPFTRQDEFGVSRYFYAAPGCEYGRYED